MITALRARSNPEPLRHYRRNRTEQRLASVAPANPASSAARVKWSCRAMSPVLA